MVTKAAINYHGAHSVTPARPSLSGKTYTYANNVPAKTTAQCARCGAMIQPDDIVNIRITWEGDKPAKLDFYGVKCGHAFTHPVRRKAAVTATKARKPRATHASISLATTEAAPPEAPESAAEVEAPEPEAAPVKRSRKAIGSPANEDYDAMFAAAQRAGVKRLVVAEW
jgi:hypothetical protein